MPSFRLSALLLLALATRAASAAPVLMISIDGMKPEYVTQADAHGLHVPYLRSLLHDGAGATGVTGVWPTNTYPSHTTMVTGVSPADHGLVNNTLFDPERKLFSAWYWYYPDIQVPTLWHAAHAAGIVTASVGWPATVGCADIDYLIPEYWRGTSASGGSNPQDRNLMAALSRPITMLAEMQSRLGPYMMGNDTTVEADEIKTRFSLDILRQHKPGFMTIHLSALDESQHKHGPFSPEANATIEALDGMIARLAAAARANDPSTVIVVVSDHGFAQLTHEVDLATPFIQAGLVDLATDPKTKAVKVVSWRAQPWLASGMAAVMLHDPNDTAVRQQVAGLLKKLAADPANGIDAILDADAMKQRGGFPAAAFVIVMKVGYHAIATPTADQGGHGFSPEFPEMHSSFFAAGPGVAHRELGLIDMRQIAPTVAHILNAPLPTAKSAPLPIQP